MPLGQFLKRLACFIVALHVARGLNESDGEKTHPEPARIAVLVWQVCAGGANVLALFSKIG